MTLLAHHLAIRDVHSSVKHDAELIVLRRRVDYCDDFQVVKPVLLVKIRFLHDPLLIVGSV